MPEESRTAIIVPRGAPPLNAETSLIRIPPPPIQRTRNTFALNPKAASAARITIYAAD